MNEIKCPKCGTVFKIDEDNYESILKQIKDHEFNKELELKEKEFIKDKENALELLKVKTEKEYLEKINNLSLENSRLNDEIKLKDKEYLLKEKSLEEKHINELKSKDEMISYYKDLKTSLSTKMVGETLESHCMIEFNKLRALFPNAYFEKDNDASSGSKGDFIFRDFDNDGVEIVSIMFEMKNENDTTATKHKNEDFFKELDKDRKEKNCEYAVLVSLLEKDNDLYNGGITDVSYRYDKMYVIRPNSFISIITLLRSASLNALEYKKELILAKNTNIDISHFEENIEAFKEGFGRNYRLASEKFSKAIEEIDKTIDHLQKTKEALLSSDKNLELANKKASELTIKKLTKNSETVAKMFEEEKRKNQSN